MRFVKVSANFSEVKFIKKMKKLLSQIDFINKNKIGRAHV